MVSDPVLWFSSKLSLNCCIVSLYRFTSLFVLLSVAIKTNLAQLYSLDSANFHHIMSVSRISVRSVCSVTGCPSITGTDVILSSLRSTPGEQTGKQIQMEIELSVKTIDSTALGHKYRLFISLYYLFHFCLAWCHAFVIFIPFLYVLKCVCVYIYLYSIYRLLTYDFS